MTGRLRQLPAVREHAEATMHAVLGHGGEPLSAETRADLEPRFGADLSAVRVHADEAASASARQLNASAYTAGQHVVFGAGRYAPGTGEGRALLAHEITHTIQQRHVGEHGHVGAAPDRLAPAGTESAARHASAQALAGVRSATVPGTGHVVRATPAIEPTAPAIAREEGTAEVVDTVTDYQQAGTVVRATMQRDRYKTHAEAQQARASGGPAELQPGYMNTGYAPVSLDTANGELTIPIKIAVRHATAEDIKLGKPTELAKKDISHDVVEKVGKQFIAEVNSRLNNWFTLYVPPCQGIAWSGRELPIKVTVTWASAGESDWAVAVSQHSGRSFTSYSSRVLVLYSGDFRSWVMRHEGAHMALGVPDEYPEEDEQERRANPQRTAPERNRYDYTMAGDAEAWGVFAVLRERHFSFVPVFVQAVLTSLGHPECVPVLHEVHRPQPRLLRVTAGEGFSTYGGLSLHLEGGADAGWFLDAERDWRAFLGVHGHAFLGSADQRNAYLLGARIGIEHKWRSSRLGPTVEAYAEGGVATETGTGARGVAPFVGTGASVGVSGWPGRPTGTEWQLKLTGGEVVRLDAEKYHAFQVGLQAGLSW